MQASLMSQHIPIMQYIEFFIRVMVAAGCGAIIGVERSRRLKEAGVRTHLLVCCGAALMIVISKYGFADMINADGTDYFGTRGADPARVAAQVVSSISFLCAGVIFKQGSVVKGLTTAAGLWATAGIGLALGAGMYPLGIFSTVLVLLMQIIMHRFPVFNDHYQNNQIRITVNDDTNFRRALSRQLDLNRLELRLCVNGTINLVETPQLGKEDFIYLLFCQIRDNHRSSTVGNGVASLAAPEVRHFHQALFL